MIEARPVAALDAPLPPGDAADPAVVVLGGRPVLVQRGDTGLVAVDLRQPDRTVRFPAPWPRRYGTVALAPGLGLALFAGVHALRAVDPAGATRWEVRHACWEDGCPDLHERVLLAVSPSGERMLTVTHYQETLAVHRAGEQEARSELDATDAVPSRPGDIGPAAATDLRWDYYGGFLDEETVIAGTSESDQKDAEEYGGARHWLLAAEPLRPAGSPTPSRCPVPRTRSATAPGRPSPARPVRCTCGSGHPSGAEAAAGARRPP